MYFIKYFFSVYICYIGLLISVKEEKKIGVIFIIIGLLMILLNLFLQGTDPFYLKFKTEDLHLYRWGMNVFASLGALFYLNLILYVFNI